MAKRIDALGRDDSRLDAFGGSLLDSDVDDALQQLVEQAASEVHTPIALVSLVLSRTQFFRAHRGLPAELAVAQATDRDLSFCQFVVRDGTPFEVTDAVADSRVPQGLVDRYGIRAYLGMPVTADGEVVGSLCVIDTASRPFSDIERAALVALSDRVSERLSELAHSVGSQPSDLEVSALTPAFAEVRNLMVPLTSGVRLAQVLSAELAPVARLADASVTDEERGRALSSLSGTLAAIDELAGIHDDIAAAAASLSRQVFALEQASLNPRDDGDCETICRAAIELAHHVTKLVGGVRFEQADTLSIATNTASAIRLVAAALGEVSAAARRDLVQSGIDLAVSEQRGRIVATMGAGDVDVASALDAVQKLAANEAAVDVELLDGGLALRFWPR
jgi:hypothetical protein